MPLPSALTNDQKADLRAERYQARAFLALNPNAVVATARINQVSFSPSTAEITFDNGSGTGDVLVGQTVLISRTNNMRSAYFRGRVRKPISGATLFINETSADFNDDDYIFILNDVALHPKLPRNDGTTDYIDYDVTFRQMLPIVYNLQSAYVITLDGTPQADLALSPLAYATTEGASISTWSWSAPSASFQVGNSSTQNVTLRWTSAGVYWVRLTVTDNGGRSNYMTFPVFVCSADYSDSFIQTGVDDLVISGNEAGYTCTVNAFDGVNNVLDQTLAVVFSVERANGNPTPIVSNVNFVGRLRNNTIATDASTDYVNLQDTNITIEDIAVQMARCPIVTWSWTDDSTPAEWGEINGLTIWRTVVSMATDFSTLSNVSSIQFDSVANTFRTFDIDQSDTALSDAINRIADAINARLMPAPQGDIYVYRSARFLSPSARNALITVMNFELQDMTAFSIDTDPAKLIGRQISYGGSYNTSSQDILLLEAIAPAVAPAEGVGKNETINQVLSANLGISDAQVEIGERVANDFETRNFITKINATLHDGFHFIVPCNFQWYTFDIPTSANNRGLAYTASDRWLLESVQAVYRNDIGTWDVSGTFAIETIGGNYQVVAQVAPNEQPFYFDPYPIDDAYPFFPDEDPFYPEENPPDDETPNVDKNDTQPINNPAQPPAQSAVLGGDVVAVWDSARVWLTKNYTKSANPKWDMIFDTGDNLTDFKFAVNGNGAYALTNDGTNSAFWRTSNVFAGNPTWMATALTGVYELIRTTDTAGEVYVGFGTSCGESFIFNSLASLPSNVSLYETKVPPSTNVTGIFTATYYTLPFTPFTRPKPTTFQQNQFLFLRFDCEVECDGSVTCTFRKLNQNTMVQYIYTSDDGVNWTLRNSSWWGLDFGIGNYTLTWTNPGAISYKYLRIYGYHTAFELVSVVIGSGASGATTRYSTNGGSSFSAPVIVGTQPSGLGGIDTQRIGNLVFAGADALIREATNGGAYSDTTNGATTGTFAKLIRTFGQSGTKLIFGTASAISGDTLWKIDGGLTAITPNDGVNNGLVVSDNCLDMWITSDSIILGVFNFGGTYKLGRSTDGGNTWSFATTNIDSGSRYLRVRQSDTQRKQVYLLNTDDTVYSSDGGITTQQVKTAPSSSLIGIEVKS